MNTDTHTLTTRKSAPWTMQLSRGCRRALQWRLLLLWLLALALPLLAITLPLWIALAGQLDHSLLAQRLIEGVDPSVLIETMSGLGQRGYSPASAIGALLVFALMLPWLTGTVIAAARSTQALGFGALVKGGLADYWRMARLWVWAAVPLGIAAGVTAGALHFAKERGLTMVLEADADHLKTAALVLGALLFLLADATLDAARAQLVLEPRRRSVVLAWWRATGRLLRRPGRIGLYLLITAAGLLLAALLGWLRIQVVPISGPGFALTLLLGQALVLALAWMRCARLFALVEAGRA